MKGEGSLIMGRSFLVRSGAGAPVTGAAGSFTAIARTRAGLVPARPPIVELGVGLYEIQPTPADEAEGVIVLVDVGAGRLVRRFCFAVYRPDAVNQFFAFVLRDRGRRCGRELRRRSRPEASGALQA